MLTRIHVNQAVLRRNLKHGTTNPAITVKTSRANRYAREVMIHGPSRLVAADPVTGRKPLSCGARIWIETEADVTLIDECEPQ